jgi:hypothetical protein
MRMFLKYTQADSENEKKNYAKGKKHNVIQHKNRTSYPTKKKKSFPLTKKKLCAHFQWATINLLDQRIS